MSYVQYIIINEELNMSPGKIAAQAAHASQMFVRNYFIESATLETTIVSRWYNDEYKKIILKVKNLKEMNKLIKKLEDEGFEEGYHFFRVVDLGYTEIPKGSVTALGFLPMEKEDIAYSLRRLRVL